jgi:hypothetical protein
MSRRYRKSRRDKDIIIAIVAIVSCLVLLAGLKYLLILGVIVGTVVLIIKMVKRLIVDDQTEEWDFNDAPNDEITLNNTVKPQQYFAKPFFMTDCERNYYDALREVAGDGYIIHPQVNLASVVEKNSDAKYRNELFRNVDFGIFDKDYKLIVLIEINDATHNHADRRERDERVRDICKEAGIPIIMFWTSDGVNRNHMREALSNYLWHEPHPVANAESDKKSEYIIF